MRVGREWGEYLAWRKIFLLLNNLFQRAQHLHPHNTVLGTCVWARIYTMCTHPKRHTHPSPHDKFRNIFFSTGRLCTRQNILFFPPPPPPQLLMIFLLLLLLLLGPLHFSFYVSCSTCFSLPQLKCFWFFALLIRWITLMLPMGKTACVHFKLPHKSNLAIKTAITCNTNMQNKQWRKSWNN